MLINDDTTPKSCEGPAKTDSTAASVTAKAHMYHGEKNQMCVIDTQGFNDSHAMSDLDVAMHTHDFLEKIGDGIHCGILVMQMSRISHDTSLHLDALSMILEKGWEKHSVLVLTFFGGEILETEEQQKNEIAKWLGEDEKMNEFVARFDTIILTDNAISSRTEEYCRPFRQGCLAKIKEAVARTQEKTFGVFSKDRLEVIKRVSDHYADANRRRHSDILDLVEQMRSCGIEIDVSQFPMQNRISRADLLGSVTQQLYDQVPVLRPSRESGCVLF